jgi:hypothetical protein
MSEYPASENFSRRDLLKGAAVFVAGAYLLKQCGSSEQEPEDIAEPEKIIETNLFDSEAANDVAGRLLIERTSYWQTAPETMNAIQERSDWDKEDRLLPIFPSAVMDYEKDIKRVAEELNVPINIVGIIAAIESAGKPDADSSVANGLFQVVPGIHHERIDRVAEDNGLAVPKTNDERIKALQIPYIGCRVGMEILLEYRDNAIAQNDGLDANSPVIWARALASYNGGPSNGGKKYEDMPLESQLYSVHAIRYITDAAVASGLRAKGHNDQEVHDAMLSKRVDSDTYAYSKCVEASSGMDSIADYELIWATIAGKNEDKKLSKIIRAAHKDFDNGKSGYKLPLTPAIRIWAAHGGLSLLRATPKNVDPASYAY